MSRTIIGESKRTASSGNIIHESVFSLEPKKILFHFTNSGQLPAINIKKSSYVAIKESEQLTNIVSLEDSPLPSIAPGEKYSIDIFYDKIHSAEAHLSDKCYFGLRLDYEDSNDNKYFYRMKGHFIDSGYLYLDEVDMN